MTRFVAIAVCAFGLLVTAQARADAVVRVIVRNMEDKPVDGRVELSPLGDGKTFSCTTSQGSCTIRSVPGGRYLAVFKPNKGSATAPKKVMIPPDGTADLHIAAK